MGKIEVENVDLVLLRGQISVLCEIAEWLDHSFTDEERKQCGMPYCAVDALEGVVNLLGERQETECTQSNHSRSATLSNPPTDTTDC